MVESGIHIDRRPENLLPLLSGRRVVVLCDSFFRGCGLPVPLRDVPVIWLEASECAKTLETVEKVVAELVRLRADRDVFLLGIGGGITTDLTGFVASIYKRGVSFGLVPTTLLAQVDASVGGKNGVNFDGYKNVLGCFTEPDFVFICPVLTATLPQREFRCGLAEMLKTFLTSDPKCYELAVRDCRGFLTELVIRCVEIKGAIVARDPRDTGERRKLNLGHTFAHAIEKCTDRYRHGEAVAIGIVMAARMAEREGVCDTGLAARLVSDFASLSLPVEAEGVSVRDLEAAMLQDKKRECGRMCYVLPVRIGEVKLWEKSATVSPTRQ